MKEKKEIDFQKEEKKTFIIRELLIFIALVAVSFAVSYSIYHFGKDKYEYYQVIVLMGGIAIAVLRLIKAIGAYFNS